MKLTFTYILFFFFLKSYSQNTFIFSIRPNWNNNNKVIIKSQNIKADSVYFYKKKSNNKDSALIMTQYFDSKGNLIERDEYNFNGDAFRITNFIYNDTVLLKEETISRDIFYINESNLSKKIKTYDRDGFGNIILEKEYSYFGDSLNSMSVTQWNREYDNLGLLIKEFVTLPKAKPYLYHSYNYSNRNLIEVKTFNFKGEWMYSYLYDYDDKTNTKSVYLFNNERTLSHEYFYKDSKLVMEKDYDQGRNVLDNIKQTYFYKPNGLLESQILLSLNDKHYYYKHFYSK